MEKMKGNEFSLWNKIDLEEDKKRNKQMHEEMEKMKRHANKHGCKFKLSREDDD